MLRMMGSWLWALNMALGPRVPSLSPFLNGLSAGAGYCECQIYDGNEADIFLPELPVGESAES